MGDAVPSRFDLPGRDLSSYLCGRTFSLTSHRPLEDAGCERIGTADPYDLFIAHSARRSAGDLRSRGDGGPIEWRGRCIPHGTNKLSGPWKPEIDSKNPMKRWFQKLLSPDRRRGKRLPLPGLVAYYWDGGVPEPHGIQAISSSGMYLLTDQQWYRGTLVTMTLQRTDNTDDGLERSIAVQ